MIVITTLASLASTAERSYGMPFGEKDIHFRVDGDILRVYNVTEFVKKQQESSADCGK